MRGSMGLLHRTFMRQKKPTPKRENPSIGKEPVYDNDLMWSPLYWAVDRTGIETELESSIQEENIEGRFSHPILGSWVKDDYE